MTKLSCSVCTCAHNDKNLCSLNYIYVSGGASKANTCCSSFAESNDMTNCACGSGSPDTDIHCGAQDCVHNENLSCHADDVDVSSYGNAIDCKDTECSSFCKR